MYAVSRFKVFMFIVLLLLALDKNVSLAEPQPLIGSASKLTNVAGKASTFAGQTNNKQTILPPSQPSNVAEGNTCNNNSPPTISDGKITATEFDKWADYVAYMAIIIGVFAAFITGFGFFTFLYQIMENNQTRKVIDKQLKQTEKFQNDAHERFENQVKINKEILVRQLEQQNIKNKFAQKFVEASKSSSGQDDFRRTDPLDVLFSHHRQIIKLEKDMLNLESRDTSKVIEALKNIAQYDVIIEELRNYLLLIDDQQILDQQHFKSFERRKISDQFLQVIKDLDEKLETKK